MNYIDIVVYSLTGIVFYATADTIALINTCFSYFFLLAVIGVLIFIIIIIDHSWKKQESYSQLQNEVGGDFAKPSQNIEIEKRSIKIVLMETLTNRSYCLYSECNIETRIGYFHTFIDLFRYFLLAINVVACYNKPELALFLFFLIQASFLFYYIKCKPLRSKFNLYTTFINEMMSNTEMLIIIYMGFIDFSSRGEIDQTAMLNAGDVLIYAYRVHTYFNMILMLISIIILFPKQLKYLWDKLKQKKFFAKILDLIERIRPKTKSKMFTNSVNQPSKPALSSIYQEKKFTNNILKQQENSVDEKLQGDTSLDQSRLNKTRIIDLSQSINQYGIKEMSSNQNQIKEEENEDEDDSSHQQKNPFSSFDRKDPKIKQAIINSIIDKMQIEDQNKRVNTQNSQFSFYNEKLEMHKKRQQSSQVDSNIEDRSSSFKNKNLSIKQSQNIYKKSYEFDYNNLAQEKQIDFPIENQDFNNMAQNVEISQEQKEFQQKFAGCFNFNNNFDISNEIGSSQKSSEQKSNNASLSQKNQKEEDKNAKESLSSSNKQPIKSEQQNTKQQENEIFNKEEKQQNLHKSLKEAINENKEKNLKQQQSRPQSDNTKRKSSQKEKKLELSLEAFQEDSKSNNKQQAESKQEQNLSQSLNSKTASEKTELKLEESSFQQENPQGKKVKTLKKKLNQDQLKLNALTELQELNQRAAKILQSNNYTSQEQTENKQFSSSTLNQTSNLMLPENQNSESQNSLEQSEGVSSNMTSQTKKRRVVLRRKKKKPSQEASENVDQSQQEKQ